VRRSIRGITGEVYTADEKTAPHGFEYTEVCNFGEFQFKLHDHGYTDKQLTAVVLVWRDGLDRGREEGRKELQNELREMLGIAGAVQP